MSQSPRPQKVTMACLLAGIGSLIVLISAASMLADWPPGEVKSEVESMVGQPPLDTYDLGVDQVLEWMRLAMMAVAAASVAAIILALYTARRHKGSRIALTIVSATSSLLFLASGLAGLLPAGMAIVCIVLLWSRDANDWFNPDRARRHTEVAGGDVDTPASSSPPTGVPPGQQAPTVEQGSPAPPVPQYARPADVPFGTAPQTVTWPSREARSPGVPPGSTVKLPGTVLAAVLTATIMAGVVVLAGLAVLAGYAAAPGELGAELLDNPALENNPQIESLGWSAETLGEIVVYSMAGLLVLALAAIGAALWMLRRSNVARIVLVVLSGITIALSVVATIVGIPWIAAAVTVIVLVFRPSSNAYFRRTEEARR